MHANIVQCVGGFLKTAHKREAPCAEPAWLKAQDCVALSCEKGNGGPTPAQPPQVKPSKRWGLDGSRHETHRISTTSYFRIKSKVEGTILTQVSPGRHLLAASDQGPHSQLTVCKLAKAGCVGTSARGWRAHWYLWHFPSLQFARQGLRDRYGFSQQSSLPSIVHSPLEPR